MLIRKAFMRELYRSNQSNLLFFSTLATSVLNCQITRVIGSEVEELVGGREEGEGNAGPPYVDVPRPGRKWERKPYPTPMKVLIRRAKEERMTRKENPCHAIENAPDNGLLVPELIDVAQHVYHARESLMHGTSLLLERHTESLIVHRCRFCREVHIGRHGHEIRTCEGSKGASRNALHVWRQGGIRDILYFPKCYHLYDRVLNPRVGHKERFEIPRRPGLVELCIQAGFDLDQHPTKRRTKPVYSMDGRIVDFEREDKDDDSTSLETYQTTKTTTSGLSNATGIDEIKTMSELSTETLLSWLKMRSGAEMIMKKYSVWTCGYCAEIQVGPKGHKVRRCKATGHQYRDGLHAWQEATINDLVGPNYVWHVKEPNGLPLSNELKRYYGKAPAVVELCVQAGASVPDEYTSMMRLDVVAPTCDEYDLVA